MNRPRRIALALFLSLLAHSAAHAADPQTVVVDIPQGDKLTISIPEGWHTKGAPRPAGGPPTVSLTTADESVVLQMTFIPDLQNRFATKESIERTATQAARQFAAGSTEKRIDLKQIESKNVRGSYATFTDAELAGVKELRPGQWRIASTGVFVIGKQVASMTILSNDTTSPAYRRALAVVAEGITTR